jgi:hypothetical protein
LVHLLHDSFPLVMGDTKPGAPPFGMSKLRRFRARPKARFIE